MRHFSCIKDLKQTGCGREEQKAQALPPESFWGFGKVRGELSGKEDRMRKNYRTLVSVVAAAAMFLSSGMPISAVNAETVDMAQDTDPEPEVPGETPQDGTSQNETPQDSGTAEAAESAGSEAQAEEGGMASTESLASAESSSAAPEQAGEESAEAAAPGEGSTEAESVSAESTETSTESGTEAPSESSTGAVSEATADASADETTGDAAEETTGTTDDDLTDLPTAEELDAQIKEEEDALEIRDETASVTGTAKSNDTVIVGYAGFPLEEGSLSEQAPEIDGYTFNGGITLDGVEASKIYSEVEETSEEKTYSVRVGEDDKVQEETVTRDVVTEKTKVTKAETANGTITISGDTSVVFTYDEDHTTTTLTAEYVDAFGDPIDAGQESVSVPFAEGKDEITLKENFPKKLQVAQDGSGKKVREYTFESTYIRENDAKVYVTAIRRVKTGDGYAYEVKKDGSDDYTELSGDTTLYVQYSDGQKAQYTYNDVNVTVTATLQHAGAIPDDARFIVTQVTPATDGYNYDAYMDALNGSEEDAAYDESNTLLYDIAFLGYAMDADGSIDTSKTIEYQPAEGSVKIDIQFHKNQLSGTLGADEDSDVTVTHLPLKDEVKAESDTTKDATAISADDVEVEEVSADASVADNTVHFDAQKFSVYAINDDGTGKNLVTGSATTYEDVLGDAVEYGITANAYNHDSSHTQTNFAVYSYSRGDQVNEVNLAGTNDVPIYVGKIESGLRFGQNTSGGNAMSYDVYTAEQDPGIEIDNKDKIKVNIYNGDKYDENYVSNLIKYSSGRSAALLREGNQNDLNNENLTGDQNQLYIDTTGADENATIYFRADDTDTNFLDALTKDFAIRINKHAGQTIVFNITADANTSGSNNLRISKIGVAIDSKDIKNENSYVKSDSQQDDVHNLEIDEMINRKIIWNVTSAREVELNTTAGTFLLPNAGEVNITGTSAGWIVAKGTVRNQSCEFHYIYHDRHYPNLYSSKGSVSFGATKKLLKNNDEQSLTAKEFEFGVFDSANNQIATAFNDAHGNISFTINYTQADCPKGENRTVDYLVKEIAGNDSLLNYDSSEYRVRVHLSDDSKGHIRAVPYLVTTDENNNEQETQITGNGQITFTNTVKTTPAPEVTTIDVTVSKVWDDNNNQDGIRPASVTVQLYANGKESGEAVTLSKSNSWTYTWTGLAEKENGTAIAYTVKETAVKDYTSEVTGNATTGFTITNTHTPETTSISGKKIWIDNNDQDGKRPDKITIRLLANGSEVDRKEVTKGNGWKYKFENLPVYENGEKINYTIKEDAVQDYTSEVSGYNLTNTYTPVTPDKPDQPTPDKPDQPTPDKPDQPTPDKPDQPTPDKPDQPTPDKPDQPTPDKPDQPTPDKPDQPTPDQPDQPTPDKPDQPAPDTPSTPDTPTSKSGSVTLTATKQLIGADLEAGDFSFEVTEDGNVVATGTNDASGLIQFSTISYTAVGEHDYSVYEDTGSLPNVTYDTTVYSVHVSVVDEGSDTLTVKVAGADNMVFTNTYNGNHPNGDTPDNGSDSSNGGGGRDTGNTPHNDGTNEFFEEDESDNQSDQLIFEDEDANESDHETEETSEDSDMNVPQTGDDSNLMIWFVLIAMAVMGITGSSIYRKKKDERQNEQ